MGHDFVRISYSGIGVRNPWTQWRRYQESLNSVASASGILELSGVGIRNPWTQWRRHQESLNSVASASGILELGRERMFTDPEGVARVTWFLHPLEEFEQLHHLLGRHGYYINIVLFCCCYRSRSDCYVFIGVCYSVNFGRWWGAFWGVGLPSEGGLLI